MNQDEADRCVSIAKRKLAENDVAGALRFAKKAESLHDSPEVQALLRRLAHMTTSAANDSNGARTTAATSAEGATAARRRNAAQQTTTPDNERSYTPEQASIVSRIRKCKHTAFYEILDLKREATDGEVKKSYRKLALQLHPDKNGAPGADEAFKMVSRAFQILSDGDKRSHFDRYGADPDSRGGGGGGGAASVFTQARGHPGFGGFGDEMAAEDLFNMFFGGGRGMHGGGFDSPFVSFGGPGIRVHHFGGGGFSGQTGAANAGGARNQSWIQLLPLIVILGFSVLSSLFSSLFGGGDSAGFFNNAPGYAFSEQVPYTSIRHTPAHNIPFYVDPAQVAPLSAAKLAQLDKRAETTYIRSLRESCEWEHQDRERRMNDAYGFFSVDKKALNEARNMKLKNCDELRRYGYRA
ncbi:Chaperone protein dnaJ [Savitreella phatthalungensis]